MATGTEDAENFVDSIIQVFNREPDTVPLSEVLQNNRRRLVERVADIFARKGIKSSQKVNAARDLLFRSALEEVKIQFQLAHFALFKQTETVQEILEDSFQLELEVEAGQVLLPHNREAAEIMLACLFPKKRELRDTSDVLAFMRMFLGGSKKRSLQEDRATRYKTMVWFVFLLIDLVRIDNENACREGVLHLKAKFLLLLKKAAGGEIICEESETRSSDFEGGRWSESLFGYLQGEERKPFLEDLLSQFNFEDRPHHVNRVLLAEHRRCLYRQTLDRFC
jgi:hypothetical protein